MSLVQTLFRKRKTTPASDAVMAPKLERSVKPTAISTSTRPQDITQKRFSALLEFGTRFNGSDDVMPAIEQTLRTAVKELEADLGYIMLLDPIDQTLTSEIAVSIGMEREFPERRDPYEGVEGQVARSCQPVFLTKSQMDAGNGFQFSGEALLCVPLLKQVKEGADPVSCGTLTLIRERRKRAFRASDEAVARSLAALATVSLANAAQYRTLRTSFIRSLQVMACAIEAKVPFMEGHAMRVAEVCRAIGERLQVDPDVLRDLHDGALLHEIGKIGIPDTILLKPGQLTPEEFTSLKQYPVIGYEMCKPLGLGDQILTLIRNHPERLDGTGYPDRLKYGELPLPLRILCVADAFDAMSSYRPYRKVAMDSRARQEQLNRFAGTQFDPIVVESLKGLLSEGKLEDLYQEHWAKHAGETVDTTQVSAPIAMPESPVITVEMLLEDDLAPALPSTAGAYPTAGIYLSGEAEPEPMYFGSRPMEDAVSADPAAASIGDTGLTIEAFLDYSNPDAVKMTLEEAAMEAAAFAAAALESVREDKAA